MKLGDEAISSCTAGIGITALYGRNRCTLRTEYAPGSVELDPSWDMRLLPEDGAEAHPGFIPVFEEPKHKATTPRARSSSLRRSATPARATRPITGTSSPASRSPRPRTETSAAGSGAPTSAKRGSTRTRRTLRRHPKLMSLGARAREHELAAQ